MQLLFPCMPSRHMRPSCIMHDARTVLPNLPRSATMFGSSSRILASAEHSRRPVQKMGAAPAGSSSEPRDCCLVATTRRRPAQWRQGRPEYSCSCCWIAASCLSVARPRRRHRRVQQSHRRRTYTVSLVWAASRSLHGSLARAARRFSRRPSSLCFQRPPPSLDRDACAKSMDCRLPFRTGTHLQSIGEAHLRFALVM